MTHHDVLDAVTSYNDDVTASTVKALSDN